MRDKAQTLARLHRVRTIQLGLARADEARAHEKAANEAALGRRIAELADGVAPAPASTGGFSLGAAAHYRNKLQVSAAAAVTRTQAAEARARSATDAAQAAWRDQAAMEKLIAKADREAIRKELRALEDTPLRPKRHDPC